MSAYANPQVQPLIYHEDWPSIDSRVVKDPTTEAFIQDILVQMSLEEKIGQMIQPDLREVTPEEVAEYKLGTILNGGGAFPKNDKYATARDWVETADEYYQAVVGEQLLSTSHILWTYLRGFEPDAFVFVEADGTHWTADEMVECLKQTTSQGLKFVCACVVFGLPKEGEVLEEVRPEKYMQVMNPPTPDPSELLN